MKKKPFQSFVESNDHLKRQVTTEINYIAILQLNFNPLLFIHLFIMFLCLKIKSILNKKIIN